MESGRGFGFWVGYLGVTALLVLLLTEAGVRLLGLAPIPRAQNSNTMYIEDAVLPYRLRPSATIIGRSNTDEFDYSYLHNRLGFRDVERTIEKPLGVYRILALGDSFTYGIGVDFEDTFVHRLETSLNQRRGSHPRVEVINAGIPRSYPETQRLLLEHYGLDFAPDLVLVHFLPNDVIDTYYGLDAVDVTEGGYLITSDAVRALEALPAPLRWIEGRCHLAHWLFTRVVTARRERRMPVVWSDVYVENGAHEVAWQKLEKQYAAMVEFASAHGIQIAFVHIPHGWPLDDSAAYPGRRLARFCEQQRVLCIDLLAPIRAAQRERELYWPRDGHANREGARVIARGLFDALRDRVPSSPGGSAG